MIDLPTIVGEWLATNDNRCCWSVKGLLLENTANNKFFLIYSNHIKSSWEDFHAADPEFFIKLDQALTKHHFGEMGYGKPTPI